MPKIELIKEKDEIPSYNNVWTYAHELGHHFAIKEKDDHSEKAADNYIITLAKRCLNDFEIGILEIGLNIHSGIKLSENYSLLDPYAKEFAKEKIKKKLIESDQKFIWGLGSHFRKIAVGLKLDNFLERYEN